MGVLANYARIPMMVALLTITLACTNSPEETEFVVGMSKSELLGQFGKPAARQTVVKGVMHMFGPIETFWSSLPDQSKVEIWSYPANGGNVELYFLNDANVVSGRGFAPEGVVY